MCMIKRIERILVTIALSLTALASAAQDGGARRAAMEAMAKYEYSKAIELLDEAMASVDDKAELKDLALQKARCQKKLLRYDAAAETLAPGMLDVELAGELADCHVASGRLGDALSLYNILSIQHPDNLYLVIQKTSLLFKVGDFEGCAQEGKAICRKEPIPSILSLVGASSMKTGQVDSALFYYRKSLELNPLNPATVTSISGILMGRKEYDGVISMARDFLEEIPDNLQVGQVLGVAYYLKEDQDEAYEVFKWLRNEGDDSYGTMYYSGLNALALNRFKVAADCFGAAWQIDSSDAKLASNYAVALKKDNLVPGNQKKAEAMFKKAVELTDPALMYKIHSGLGEIYYMRENFADALSHYKEAYSYAPENRGLLVSIAYCHEMRKEYKIVLSYYEKYLSTAKPGTKNYNFATQAVTHIKAELHMME